MDLFVNFILTLYGKVLVAGIVLAILAGVAGAVANLFGSHRAADALKRVAIGLGLMLFIPTLVWIVVETSGQFGGGAVPAGLDAYLKSGPPKVAPAKP